MSSGFGTPARKRRNNKETPPRERAGNTGTTREIIRHQMREQEEKKESSSLSVLRKNPTLHDLKDLNKNFDELEGDLSEDDLGLISYNDDDNNTSVTSITDEKEKGEKEKGEKERRKTLQEKHIKKEKNCTLEDCTITGGTKRRRRSKRRKTNKKKTKKKRGKKAGGVSERPPPLREPDNEQQRIVRNFSDTIFTIGSRIGRNETIYNDEFESIVNVGRGQLSTALLEMFPIERQGDRRASIRFVTQLRDFVNLQMPPANMDQRLHHGELVRALDYIIGFLSNRQDRGSEYVEKGRNN